MNAILIVALDAELRQAVFDRLAAAGYRVDAVADAAAAEQRLARDHYALVAVEAGREPPSGDGPRLEISAALLAAGSRLEVEVERALEDS